MTVFDDAALRQAVTQALHDADVPADHRNAFLVVATSDGTIKGVYSSRLDHRWQVETYFKIGKDTAAEAGVSVKATWGD
jgi:hypothetical protein